MHDSPRGVAAENPGRRASTDAPSGRVRRRGGRPVPATEAVPGKAPPALVRVGASAWSEPAGGPAPADDARGVPGEFDRVPGGPGAPAFPEVRAPVGPGNGKGAATGARPSPEGREEKCLQI